MWKNPIDLKLCACFLDLRDRFEKMVKSLWYTNVAFDEKLCQMCEHCICKHSTCFNYFKQAKSNNVAICFAFWGLRQKLQSGAKPVDILNDVGSDIFDHQLCYISDAGANVAWLSSIELGSQAELYFQIPSGSLWIVLLPLAFNCGWFFLSSATVSVLLCLAFATYRVFFTVPR